jgi:hypothetical protein
MTSLPVFVDLTVQILNPSVGFPQLSKGLLDDQLYRRLLNGLQIVDCDCTPMVTHETSGKGLCLHTWSDIIIQTLVVVDDSREFLFFIFTVRNP